MPPQDYNQMQPIGQSSPSHHSMSRTVVFLTIAFIVLLSISIYMLRWAGKGIFSTSNTQKPVAQTPRPVYTQEKVIVNSADLTKGLTAREELPTVFSKDIPLPKDAKITESTVSNYTEKKIILSVYTFSTAQTAKEMYALYSTYMTGVKYTFGPDGKKVDAYLSGTKNNDDLSVTIGSNGKLTTVTVANLDRK